jgi:L-ascorbate metabolism protein UlaG (beta-lactamase superfamily)
VRTDDGKSIYFAGDTCVFGDMQLIGRLYKPDVAVLPIGDHFTMGPEEAAVAVELLGVKRVVPCHWGTFGLLTGTPDALEKLVPSGVTIEKLEPGDTVTV